MWKLEEVSDVLTGGESQVLDLFGVIGRVIDTKWLIDTTWVVGVPVSVAIVVRVVGAT